MMRIVSLGYVVHILSLRTGNEWYSGDIDGKRYVYKQKADAQRYANMLNGSDSHVADVEEYEH